MYRNWSDVFIEQGIIKKGTFDATKVHIVIKPFSYENYIIVLNALYNHDNGSVPVSAKEKTATTFVVQAVMSYIQYWQFMYVAINQSCKKWE